MKYYAPENAHFKLPYFFDIDLLRKDLARCKKFDFLQNYVPANYNGKNYILPLRSIGGKLNFPAALPDNSELYKDTEALKHCKYIRHVIDTFKCKKEAIRFMSLPPGGIVNKHVDHSCGYEDGVFRIHVPVETNEKVCFTLNGKDIYMRAGEAWYTNVNLPHSVVNAGDTHRVHLVIDCIRNEWSDELFESMGFDFSQEKEVQEKIPKETLDRMIEELEMSENADAKRFLKELKARHGL